MSRSVTVVFGNGETHVYQNVPLDITPDQIEERAARDFPNQPVREVMGIDILYKELRDAVASRTATIADLEQIAAARGRRIDDQGRASLQTWLDYAADRPNDEIPQNIFTPPVSRTEAVATGATQGFQNVANFLPRIAAWAADRFGLTPANSAAWVAENLLGYSRDEAQDIRRNLSRSDIGDFGEVVSAGAQSLRERPDVIAARQQRPNYFAGGQILGELTGTAPFIGAAGAGAVSVAPRLAPLSPAAQRVLESGGRAIQTGGFSPTAATRGGRAAQRVFGGGTTAGATAAVTAEEPAAQDILTEAGIGAALPFIGTMARQGAGYTYDLLRRRLGEVRAGEIMRNLIANNSEAIINALRSAPDDARTNTAEFLASQGLLTPELAAATRIVGATPENAPLLERAQARAAGQEEMRATLRGGATGTEAMQNIGGMRQQVAAETDPLREEALRRADVGRTQILPAEARAAELRNAAAEVARRAARFYRAGDEQSMVLGQMDDLGDPFAAEAINRQRGIVGGLESRGLGFGQRSVDLGAEARGAQEVAANLRAQGLQPLNISNVVGDLRRKAAEAQFVNPARYNLLTSFADNLQNRAQMMGGVIDATGLYELRKSMADTVSQLLGPMDPAALQRRTAELVGEVRPLIDDAIETAGGTGWRDYLNRFTAGMQNVERQEFGRVLAELPEARLERVMAGNDPDFVSKFFGPGRYDINVELFGSQLPTAHRLAAEVAATRDVASGGLRDVSPSVRGMYSAGLRRRVMESMEPGLNNYMARSLFRLIGSAPRVGGGGIAAERLEQEIAERTARNAMRALSPGLAEPSEALRLVGVRGTNAMTGELMNRLDPMQRAFLSQSIQGLTMPPSQIYEVPMAPEDQSFVGFQVGPNGEEIPVYAPTRVQR